MANIQCVTTSKSQVVIALLAYLHFTAMNGKIAVEQETISNPEKNVATVVAPEPEKTQVITDARAALWMKFQGLVNKWRDERGSMSSITEMSTLAPYQKIIGMGPNAVPFILSELKSEGDDPDQWFWALASITEANPVKPEDQGDFRKMAQAWFKWAEDEDYAG